MNYLVTPITSFTGDNFFLSNFYESPFVCRNVEFKSGEHAFVYVKNFFAVNPDDDMPDKILNAPTPGAAKGIGRRLKIDVKEWDKHKVMYMREIITAKFKTGDPIMVHKLLNTGTSMLIEGNDWGDKFWGRVREGDRWVGLNVLGVILMEERGWWKHGS